MTLQQYREALGMSQEKMAEALVISRRTIINWEKAEMTLEKIHPFFQAELMKIKRHHDKREGR